MRDHVKLILFIEWRVKARANGRARSRCRYIIGVKGLCRFNLGIYCLISEATVVYTVVV